MESKLGKKGTIFNVQKYSIYDGPGIRTLVFLKGCPLKCRWCANPEGISPKQQVMYLKNQCVVCGKCVNVCPVGIHSLFKKEDGEISHRVDRNIDCIGCRKCEGNCNQGAVSIAGKESSVEEIMDIIIQDSPFYWSSGGGVTIGGGEVTAQPSFALEILKECKNEGIHTAIETCGYTNWSVLEEMSKHVDLFLYDLKHIDSREHEKLVGVSNDKILENMERLLNIGANMIVRMPMIKGLNDSYEALEGAMNFIKRISEGKKLQGIEVLPYHKLGVNKYKQLDMEYAIKEDLGYTNDELERMEAFLSKFNLPIKLIKH